MSTAKTWTAFNDEYLRLRKGSGIMKGGLQLASDGMVQGDLRVVPLTSSIGYQANTHIIVHFSDGNPDMGRKVFQPELTDVAEELSRRAVVIFRRYLGALRPDTGVASASATKELFQWKVQQIGLRDKNGLSLVLNERPIAIVSKPQQEQDVIALYHEFLGAGYLRGIRILATSPHQRYDSLFVRHYPNHLEFGYSAANPLGVAQGLIGEDESEPLVLEYKYDLDSLIADFDTDTKFQGDINFVVCWKTGDAFREKFFLSSLLVGDEGTQRSIFGATHSMYSQNQKLFEVLILEDLCNYITDPAAEIARQRVGYK